MPGLLRSDAVCPKCSDDLAAIVDTTNSKGVTREYFHEKGSPKARRRPRCKVHFSSFDEAQAERRALEVYSAA